LADSSPVEAQHRPEWTRADSLFLAALLAVTFLCYLPALGYDFVYDDRLLILKNPQLLSWRFVPQFFREHFVAPVFPQAPANYYRPLLLIWMLLNRQVWGTSAAGWHLAAIALHLVVTAGVYLVAQRIRPGRDAAIAASIFALHPVHVECVAWVMGMTESFGATFLLASFLCYLRARDEIRRSRWWYYGSVAFFVCAVLAKENMIVLPALLLAWEWFLGSEAANSSGARTWIRRGWRSLLPAIPHFTVAAVYLALRVAVLGALSHASLALPLSTLFATLPRVIASYGRLLIWPAGLSAFYDVPYVTSFASRGFVVPLVVTVVALAALAVWSWKSRRAGFAAVWMLVPLLPLLNLTVFPEGEIVHDRYLYLPSMGFALLAGMAIGHLSEKLTRPRHELSKRLAISGLLLGLLGAGTCYYREFWKDNVTLFARGVAIAPENNLAANNLADEFVDRGNYEEAVPLYQQILARKPGYAMAVYNLGFCYYKLGRLDQAEHFLGRAVMLDPGDPDAYIYLGMTYLKIGRTDLAEPAVRHAIALRPGGRGFHLALGVILKERGESEQALAEFRAELAAYPGETTALAQIQELDRRLQDSQTRHPSTLSVRR
jgi:protein O-mannosyl-transferase